MFQVRIHGRGGQGVVTAAEILSVAAFQEGLFAQAFPSFGSERMGAPVMAFCRLSEREIRLREPILLPDAVLVQDPTLLHQVDLFQGLSAQGFVLINSARSLETLGLLPLRDRLPDGHVRLFPATEIAQRHLQRPLPGAALLGGFAAATGRLQLASVQAALRERFPGRVGEANAAAAAESHALAAS
jgi:pyruvate ferredoxin oxidoreductase gamma subunit